MALVPHERSLVKRLEGKRFALVGVNCDSSPEVQRRCEEEKQINWRSFFDGREGSVGKELNIRLLTVIYDLDHRGVIRYKGVRDKDMEVAVDTLLAEIDQPKK